RAASCASLSNQRQIVFFGFMFVCSLCSIRANAAVCASVRISDPPVHLLICYGRRLKLVAARPTLLNHIAGRDRLRDPKLGQAKFRIIPIQVPPRGPLPIMPGSSENLPLPDYGRVARYASDCSPESNHRRWSIAGRIVSESFHRHFGTGKTAALSSGLTCIFELDRYGR